MGDNAMVNEYPLVQVITTLPTHAIHNPIPIQQVLPNPPEDLLPVSNSGKEVISPQEGWLPITESRKGTPITAAFHLISSGIGIQALLLPLALANLGWVWGIACLVLAFAWQLYTKCLLVQLHEPVPGTRYSRYLQLAIVAFGPKMGKLLTLFPIMYLSGGTCVMLINFGGGSMELLFRTLCGESNKFTDAKCFVVFTFLAIIVAQLPNLNSMAGVSFFGTITAITYCTLLWILSVSKGRPDGVSYGPPEAGSEMARVGNALNAIGMIALAFRGHNLVLEIQGTMPSKTNQPSQNPMWRGMIVSCSIIAACLFPIAIAGYWAYGNPYGTRIPANGGLLSAFSEFHKQNTKKAVMVVIYLLILVHSLCSYQIYAMPVFDNLEFKYIRKKKKPCPRWVRAAIRVFFGVLTTFIASAVSFLGSLGPLIGGIALPLTLAYPCFMWILIKKPRRYCAMWFLNLGLGCSGIILSVMLVAAAVWKIVDKGIDSRFFNIQLQPILKPKS